MKMRQETPFFVDDRERIERLEARVESLEELLSDRLDRQGSRIYHLIKAFETHQHDCEGIATGSPLDEYGIALRKRRRSEADRLDR